MTTINLQLSNTEQRRDWREFWQSFQANLNSIWIYYKVSNKNAYGYSISNCFKNKLSQVAFNVGPSLKCLIFWQKKEMSFHSLTTFWNIMVVIARKT